MASLRVYDTWELLIKFPVHLGALKEKKINSVHDSFYIIIYMNWRMGMKMKWKNNDNEQERERDWQEEKSVQFNLDQLDSRFSFQYSEWPLFVSDLIKLFVSLTRNVQQFQTYFCC